MKRAFWNCSANASRAPEINFALIPNQTLKDCGHIRVSMKPLALLTNDDGYTSPGLRALRRELADDFELVTVAPARGKSWIGKALSNPGGLTIETQRVDDAEIFVVQDGAPADCANLGMYHLCPRKPDLVIAGINLGANYTTSLTLASGTVGAALEAAVNNVMGIAASLELDAEMERRLHETWDDSQVALFQPAARAVKLFLREWRTHVKSPRAKLINLIVPQHLPEPPRFMECAPLPYAYGSVFVKRGDAYYNRGRGFIQANDAVPRASDVGTVAQGIVAFTCYAGNLERVIP